MAFYLSRVFGKANVFNGRTPLQSNGGTFNFKILGQQYAVPILQNVAIAIFGWWVFHNKLSIGIHGFLPRT